MGSSGASGRLRGRTQAPPLECALGFPVSTLWKGGSPAGRRALASELPQNVVSQVATGADIQHCDGAACPLAAASPGRDVWAVEPHSLSLTTLWPWLCFAQRYWIRFVSARCQGVGASYPRDSLNFPWGFLYQPVRSCCGFCQTPK